MRSDMYKVVTERPRVGGGWSPKGRKANIALEDLPKKEGMRKPWQGNRKEFSDLINPLRRSLRKNVGRPWDKVYSEIVSILPKGLVARHILGHVEGDVETHAILIGKVPCYGDGWYYGHPIRSGQLYVNPNTGLLCVVKNKKRSR